MITINKFNETQYNRKITKSEENVFILWKAYQRRVDSFKKILNIRPVYIHFKWEEKTKVHKAFSYFLKICMTFLLLVREKPTLFYIQAPPTFLVYVAYIYSLMTGAKYVVDAHNAAIYGSFWCRMPFVKGALARSKVVIVHNKFVAGIADKWGVTHTILMDRPPDINQKDFPAPEILEKKPKGPIVVVPCSYDRDEPMEEMQKATIMLPDVNFYITWFREKLSKNYFREFKENTTFTGFLPAEEFNSLLSHADVILVLTNQIGTQPSGASESLSFQKPLVVSDLQIIRDLFPVGSIYVKNNAESIANGIVEALRRKDDLAMEMASFKDIKLQLWEKEFQRLMEKINI
ncbi:glycosyltransferase [Calditrichota bacterium]